jgi:hypothetical protein
VYTVTFFEPPLLDALDPLLLVLLLLLSLEPQAPSADTATRQLATASQRDAKRVPSSRKPVKVRAL